MGTPGIIALVDDLFVVSRIEAAAQPSSIKVHFPASSEEVERLLREDPPALLLVGMAATRLPWEALVRQAKGGASDHVPHVIAFGPHMDLALRERALAAGADEVLANSKLMTELPSLLSDTYSRSP